MNTAAPAQSSSAPGIIVNGIDFNSTEFVENPYAGYAALRRGAPICRIDSLNAWLFTRYNDVRKILLDDKKFQVDYENMQINRMGMDALEEPFFRFAREFVFFRDRPEHPPLKIFLRPRFSREKAEALHPRIREIAHEVVDQFIDRGEAELVAAFAHQLPLRVISDMLGVPPEDRKLMESWVQAYGPVLGFPPLKPDELDRANEATAGFIDYFSRAIADRRANPRDDLVSDFVAANDSREQPYTETQVVANIILTYIGGQDTQKNQLGNAIGALHQHPEQRAWLQESPDRIPQAIDELMRYDSASQILARVAMEDVEFDGIRVARGETVLPSAGAANRDPAIFTEPDRLDLQRIFPKPPIGFGLGPHSCLGVHLARTLIPIALDVLFARIPEMEIDTDSLTHNRTLSKRGYTRIPARWRG